MSLRVTGTCRAICSGRLRQRRPGKSLREVRVLRGSQTMSFVLTGFTPDLGFRVFAFERVVSGQPRTQHTVRADLALIRGFDIRVQDLPLLCRSLLDRREDSENGCVLTLTEEDMRTHAQVCAAAKTAAALKKKPRHAPTENTGSAWRGHVPNPVPLNHPSPANAPPANESLSPAATAPPWSVK